MKQIHVFTVFGTPKSFYDGQFRYLADHGHEIILVSSDGEGTRDFAERNHIRFIPVEMPRALSPVAILKAIKSLCAIEAMSRALPAVGTRVAGIPELLSDDYLVKKGSVDEIVRVLSTNMDKESMMKQAEENFKKASEFMLDIINARRQIFFNTFINYNSLKKYAT